jgi:hypothetical protein
MCSDVSDDVANADVDRTTQHPGNPRPATTQDRTGITAHEPQPQHGRVPALTCRAPTRPGAPGRRPSCVSANRADPARAGILDTPSFATRCPVSAPSTTRRRSVEAILEAPGEDASGVAADVRKRHADNARFDGLDRILEAPVLATAAIAGGDGKGRPRTSVTRRSRAVGERDIGGVIPRVSIAG